MTAIAPSSQRSQGTDYTIYYDGTNWNARDNRKLQNVFSNSDFAVCVNQVTAAITAFGSGTTHTINGVSCYYAFPPAPTVGAPTAGGAIDVGDHYYGVSFVSATGETIVGYCNSVSTTTGSQTVALSNIPIGPANTTARKVYRTATNVPTIATGRDPATNELFLVTTLANNSTTTFTDSVSDASIASVTASTSAPSLSDGGSITIARPTTGAIVGGVENAILVTQPIQLYTGQTLIGQGRSTYLSAQTTVQQYGTLAAAVTTSTATTITVNETTAPPAVPFIICAYQGATTLETMLVTARTPGSPASYTVMRGYGTAAVSSINSGSKVFGSAQGRGAVGAIIDAYFTDRVRIDGITVDGGATGPSGGAMIGLLHCRNQGGPTGGKVSNNYIVYNELLGAMGPEVAIGKPNDASATSNVWLMFNRIDGGGGSSGLLVAIGDGHIKFNNVCGGRPPVIINASAITLLGNHIANTNALYGDVMILGGSEQHFIGNYIDSIGNGAGAFYRPSGLGNTKDIQFVGNRYSCKTVTDGVTYIFNFLSPTDRVQIVDEHFHGTVAAGTSYKFINNAGGADWSVQGCTSSITPVSVFDGTVPTIIGNNVFGAGKYSRYEGTTTASGTGVSTYSWNHNLVGTPTKVSVDPGSSDAKGVYWISVSSTQITVNYTVAPPNGSGNLTWFWSAGV